MAENSPNAPYPNLLQDVVHIEMNQLLAATQTLM